MEWNVGVHVNFILFWAMQSGIDSKMCLFVQKNLVKMQGKK